MYSNSDFEKLWFLYKTEGEPKGISLNAFCASKGVSYNQFNSWFRKTQHRVVPLLVDGLPAESPSGECSEKIKDKPLLQTGNIQVVIQTRDGLHVRKSNLDYHGLKELVERLEGLC